MKKILIIKLGAMGDVIRTTPLLRVLGGQVYWVTREKCLPLVPTDKSSMRVVNISCAYATVRNIRFDTVLCLDDDITAAHLAAQVKKEILIGSFLNSDNNIMYTDSAAAWFDMGLISKLGKEKADSMKKANKKSYQEIVFGMLGKKFQGEEYSLNTHGYTHSPVTKKDMCIGIEARADDRWPTKRWNKYEQLAERLRADGCDILFFQQRDNLAQYINDIRHCDLVITGDTLALHIALALKINIVAIFTCTSPAEIYNYGRMTKVISPLLDKAFYSREYVREAVEAVSLESVYNAIKTMIGTPYARSIHNNSY